MAQAMSDDAKGTPHSVTLLLEAGLRDSRACANVLAATVLDVGVQRVTPQVANTMFNGIGKLLKLKEMEIKFGTASEDGGPKRLILTA